MKGATLKKDSNKQNKPGGGIAMSGGLKVPRYGKTFIETQPLHTDIT